MGSCSCRFFERQCYQLHFAVFPASRSCPVFPDVFLSLARSYLRSTSPEKVSLAAGHFVFVIGVYQETERFPVYPRRWKKYGFHRISTLMEMCYNLSGNFAFLSKGEDFYVYQTYDFRTFKRLAYRKTHDPAGTG
jgi:hypothetical protein